jgi:hypothetical protein
VFSIVQWLNDHCRTTPCVLRVDHAASGAKLTRQQDAAEAAVRSATRASMDPDAPLAQVRCHNHARGGACRCVCACACHA